MPRPAAAVERVLRLVAQGCNNSEIARAVGVSRYTVRMWRQGNLPRQPNRCDSADCDLVPLAHDRRIAYAYLLGQYLGDGCISTCPRDVYKLRIVCADAYPGIMDEVAQAIRAVMPANRVGRVAKIGCTELTSYSKHWPCLFPQHGPGRKHTRPIVLADWQHE